MNNVSGYSPCPIYGQILSVKSQMLFYAVGGSFLLCAPANTHVCMILASHSKVNCRYISLFVFIQMMLWVRVSPRAPYFSLKRVLSSLGNQASPVLRVHFSGIAHTIISRACARVTRGGLGSEARCCPGWCCFVCDALALL